MLIDWEMSKPLVLPPQEGEPWELASSREGQPSEAGQPLEQETGHGADKPPDEETVTTALPKEPSREASSDGGAPHPRPEDPVPIARIRWIRRRFPRRTRMNRGLSSMNAPVEIPHRRRGAGVEKSDPALQILFRKNVLNMMHFERPSCATRRPSKPIAISH